MGNEPLANLAPLPIKKRFLGNPTLGKYIGQRILAMRIGSGHASTCASAFIHAWRDETTVGRVFKWRFLITAVIV